MPESRRYDIQHCEEAQQILGRIPSWTIRWGVTVIFIVFAIILLGCCIIKFPEKVSATVTITTGNSPVDVVARGSGNLEQIFVSNGDSVQTGNILGIIRSSAVWKDILTVERHMKDASNLPIDSLVQCEWIYAKWGMGDIQNEWSAFSSACCQLREYLERNVIGRRMDLIIDQISKQKKYYSQMQSQEDVIAEDLTYEERSFQRDSILYARNVISETEYEESIRSLLKTRNNKVSFESQMTSTELAVLQLEQQLIELSIQHDDEVLSLEREINSCRERLVASMSSWSLNSLLISPMDGKVSFVRKWDEGQFIGSGETFLAVVPSEKQTPIGMVKIPQASFGKVKMGQKVNVRLDSYPYMEYGMLVGEIGYLSSVPETSAGSQIESQYTAEIIFPNGMTTTYGKDLKLIQKMDGTAEIITHDRRLIMRLLDPIVALFENGI